MSENKAELAKKMAAQRAKAAATRKPLPGGAGRQNALSFLGEEADGWNMSPKTILLCSVAYMGCVILLHIFGKISQLNTASEPSATPPPPSNSTGDL